MRVLYAATMILGLLANAGVRAEDCETADRDLRLASKAASEFRDQAAYDHLKDAARQCPRFENWEALGRAADKLAEPSKAAEAYSEAYKQATTNEQQADAAARYAEVLFHGGDPQRAQKYVLYAKNLTPSVPWIETLAADINKRVSEANTEDIERGLMDAMFDPLTLTDVRPGGGRPQTPRPELKPAGSVSDAATTSAQTAAVAVSPAAPAVNPAAVSVTIPINFEFNSTRVDARSLSNVTKLAHVLGEPRYASKRFLFIGHTDLRGSPEYNRVLSRRRAEALETQVIALEPSLTGRIELLGRGMDQPLSRDPREEEQRMNRRLEVVLR